MLKNEPAMIDYGSGIMSSVGGTIGGAMPEPEPDDCIVMTPINMCTNAMAGMGKISSYGGMGSGAMSIGGDGGMASYGGGGGGAGIPPEVMGMILNQVQAMGYGMGMGMGGGGGDK